MKGKFLYKGRFIQNQRETKMPLIPQLDYPLVRASAVCPLCRGAKDTGLVACWPCYRKDELKYGNPDADLKIAQAEEALGG